MILNSQGVGGDFKLTEVLGGDFKLTGCWGGDFKLTEVLGGDFKLTEVQYTPENTSRCRLMKRNGTGRLMKRDGPFTIRSSACVFSVHFESVLIKYYYIRIAQSALARGSLCFLLKSATRSLNPTLSLRTFFILFLATLSQNCTAGHGFRLDLDFFTQAGVRRYVFEFESK